MTIGLEATRANKQYKTGTEWYAWHLLQGFKKLDKNNKFIVYYNKYLADELLGGPNNFYFKNLSWPFKKFWTHFRLGWELIVHPVDKFFATNALPIFGQSEFTVTIHDLGFYINPELYHPLERVYQKLSHSLAIKRAKKIIAISEKTKADIIKYFPYSADKIRVIHLACDKETFSPLSILEKENFIEKNDYPDNYLLYIGRLETKKNIQNLIKAYKKTTRQWPLVLAGRPGNFGFDEIQSLVNDPDLKKDIILLGYVSQTNYPKLLASASAFVFPSKFEGFGMPILEAMASKVPVLCSDIEALKEVGSDAVLFFDPDNIDDIKEKIEKIFSDEDLRILLSEKGIKRAEDFSWEKTAKETLAYILE